MKRTTLRAVVIIQLFLAANTGLLYAQPNTFNEGFIGRTNRTLLQRGGEWTLLPAEMTLPAGILVLHQWHVPGQ